MATLGVNIDHIANVREARNTYEPDPVQYAFLAELGGADSITVHLREDRRHIQDKDLIRLKKEKNLHINLEMAPTKEMFLIANKIKPNVITLVPEKRKELTTEGGLNVKKNYKMLQARLKTVNPKIKVMMFIDPTKVQIEFSKKLKVYGIEINTAKYSESKGLSALREIKKIKKAVQFANEKNLYIAAGHGLNEKNLKRISKIKEIKEYNIGHSIIGNAIFYGLKESIKKIQDIIK